MSDEINKDPFDLGSDPADEFDPFASDDDLGEDTPPEKPEKPAEQAKTEVPAAKQTQAAASTPDANPNPIESAISAAETKEQQSLFEKSPVFEYAGCTEDIDDASKSFDELRIEKSTDFPELEDGKRVSWDVTYGKITKSVGDPKGTSIGKMKSDIETSKEFLGALKKAKDKNPVCKIRPRVVAQSKGTAPSYKGVFTNMDEAETAGKVDKLNAPRRVNGVIVKLALPCVL